MIPTSYFDTAQAAFEAVWELTSAVAVDAYESAPDVRGTYRAFSNSIVGKQVLPMAKGVAADFAGATVGAFFPEGVITYSVSKHRGWSQTAQLSSAVAAVSLSKSLTYFTGIELNGFLLSTAGYIAGGYEGRKLVGQAAEAKDIYDSYHVKSVQSLAAQGTVQVLRNAMPIPWVLTPVTSLFGGTMRILAGTLAANARPLTHLAIEAYNREPSPTHLDPSRIARNYAIRSNGNTVYFAQEMTDGMPLMPMILKFIQTTMSSTLDKQIGVKVFVRAMNQYTKMIKSDPEILRQLDEIQAEKNADRKAARKKQVVKLIRETIARQSGYVNQVMSYLTSTLTDAQVMTGVNMLCDMLEKTEKDVIGFSSSRDGYIDLLEVHAFCFLPLIAVQSMGPQILSKIWPNYIPELEPSEIQEFYMNMMHLAMAPYQGRTVSFVHMILERVMPTALQSTKVVPVVFDRVMDIVFDDKGKSSLEEIPESAFDVTVPAKKTSWLRRFMTYLIEAVGGAFSKLSTLIKTPPIEYPERRTRPRIPRS